MSARLGLVADPINLLGEGMKTVFRAALMALLLPLIDGHAAISDPVGKGQPLNQAKRVALVYSPELPEYRIEIGSVSTTLDRGALGHLATQSYFDEKSQKFTQKIAADKPQADLRRELVDGLAGALANKGVDVQVFSVARNKDEQPDLSALMPEKFDAVVDVTRFSNGYFANGPTTPYRRHVAMLVSVYAVADKSLVFRRNVDIQDRQLSHEFEFKSFDELMGDSSAAYSGLRDIIGSRVVPSVLYTLRNSNADKGPPSSPFAELEMIPRALTAYKSDAGIVNDVWAALGKFQSQGAKTGQPRILKRLEYEASTAMASKPNDEIKSSFVMNFEPLENGFYVAETDVGTAKSRSRQIDLSLLNFFKPVGASERDSKVSTLVSSLNMKAYSRSQITNIKIPVTLEEAVKPGSTWSYEVTTSIDSVTESKGDRLASTSESVAKVSCVNDALVPASQLIPALSGNMVRIRCASTGKEGDSTSEYVFVEDFRSFVLLGNKTKMFTTRVKIQKLE
jgi:hypothetical protein